MVTILANQVSVSVTNKGGDVEETCKDQLESARAEAIEKNQLFSRKKEYGDFK